MAQWSKRLRDVVVAFLPGPLAEIVRQGLLKTLAAVVAVIFVVPLAVILVAAFWLSFLSHSNIGLVRSMRAAYLDTVSRGFSIEEVAARSNVRLDYLQLFEYDLSPRSPSKELRLGLSLRQKAFIDIRVIKFLADGPTCTIPETDISLVDVLLGGQQVRSLSQDSTDTISLSENFWQKYAAGFGEEDLVQRLTFRLTDALRRLQCGRVHIEGGVKVYKDVFPATEASRE